MAIGDFEKAVADFEQCIMREPKNKEMLRCLGEACQSMEDQVTRLMEQAEEGTEEEKDYAEEQVELSENGWQLSEIEARRDRLLREVAEAALAVEVATREKQKAEMEVKEVQAKISASNDLIDSSAKEVMSEVMEKNLTEDQLKDELNSAIQAKAEKEEREYRIWAHKKDLEQFEKRVEPELQALLAQATEQFN